MYHPAGRHDEEVEEGPLVFEEVHPVGANDCTPEIDASENVVDSGWHVPMDCQWRFPT